MSILLLDYKGILMIHITDNNINIIIILFDIKMKKICWALDRLEEFD